MSDPVPLLRDLVAFRSDFAGEEAPIADHLALLLRARGADEVVRGTAPRAEGKPSEWVWARYGRPRILVNAHLDTVPPNPGWSGDPFTARIDGDRFTALGAADTKGAAAAILAALDEETPRDLGVLFSGDEERGTQCMPHFLASGLAGSVERAVVCEPTSLRVGTRHRGIVAFEAGAQSPGGHSSMADALPSPVADLARLAVALDDWGRAFRGLGPPGFTGLCLNVAKLDGGVAFNVIPTSARLAVSLRPPPGADVAALRTVITDIVTKTAPGASLRFLLDNVPFHTRAPERFVPLLGEAARAPIDLAFWTEEALLMQAGIDAVVFGPGDIALAHGPDEWVPVAELRTAQEVFRRLFASTHGEADGAR